MRLWKVAFAASWTWTCVAYGYWLHWRHDWEVEDEDDE